LFIQGVGGWGGGKFVLSKCPSSTTIFPFSHYLLQTSSLKPLPTTHQIVALFSLFEVQGLTPFLLILCSNIDVQNSPPSHSLMQMSGPKPLPTHQTCLVDLFKVEGKKVSLVVYLHIFANQNTNSNFTFT
jgi:hypothetical protein